MNKVLYGVCVCVCVCVCGCVCVCVCMYVCDMCMLMPDVLNICKLCVPMNMFSHLNAGVVCDLET